MTDNLKRVVVAARRRSIAQAKAMATLKETGEVLAVSSAEVLSVMKGANVHEQGATRVF